MPLTPRQLEVLDFIIDFVREHRYAPTLREMADHFDLSRVTILQHLESLEEEGYLERQSHKARGITVKRTARLVSDVTNHPSAGQVHESGARSQYGSHPDADTGERPDSLQLSSLPLLGYFSPGDSMDPIDEPETVSFGDLVCDPANCYLVEVRGSALEDEHIQHGDLLIINEQSDVEPGSVVLGGPESGPPSLYRYETEEDEEHLTPLNTDAEGNRLPLENVQISGSVAGLIRFPL